MSNYHVSEVSARSPDMGEREFAEFVEDIRTNGQLVPIWVRGDEVIDGRKRLAACLRIGIEPKVVNIDPSQDAERVARALNVLRTHYNVSQLGIFAGFRATATRSDAGRMRHSNGKNTVAEKTTTREVAREVGVSPSVVVQAKRVIRDGAPELVAAVQSGRLTLHAATQIADAIPDKAAQPAIVARAVDANKGKARHSPVSKVLEGIDRRRDRAIQHPKHEQFALAVQKLEIGAELIAKHVDAAATDVRRRDFLTTLREVRTAVSRAIHQLEAAA